MHKGKKHKGSQKGSQGRIVDPNANKETELNTEGLLEQLRFYGDPIESDFMRDNPDQNPENIVPRNYGKDMLDYYTNDGSGVNDPNSMFNRRLSGEFINDPDIINESNLHLLEREGGMSSDDRGRMLNNLSNRTVFDTTYNERKKYDIINQLSGNKENWDEAINPNTGEKYKDIMDWLENSKQGRTLKSLGPYNDFDGSQFQPVRNTFSSDTPEESKRGLPFMNVNNYRELLQSRGEDPDDPKYNELWNYIVMNPGQMENFTKNNNSKYIDEYNTTYAHEIAHGGYGRYLSERDEAILKNLNRSYDNLGENYDNVSDHHSDTAEIHSDLSAIRQDMIDKGIYDYKAGQMTKKNWQQYLNSYPEGKYPLVLKRTLERYTIPDTDNPHKNIIYINNAVAQEGESDQFVGKYGGRLYKAQYGHPRRFRDAIEKSRIVDRTFKKAAYGLPQDTGIKDNLNSQSNPKNRKPQLELNKFINKHVLPEYGGTVELWKEILNEISYHESGHFNRFDPNAEQLFTELSSEATAKGPLQIENKSSKTNLNRLFNTKGGYEKLYSNFIQDDETGQFKGNRFLNQLGDTITYSDFPELEKLYYSQRNVKTTSHDGRNRDGIHYSNLHPDSGVHVGWKGEGENFDIRKASVQSQGILALVELLSRQKLNPEANLNLSNYFNKDKEGNISLTDQNTRAKLWGKYYNTDPSSEKITNYMAASQEYSNYKSSEGLISQYSRPGGYGGDLNKETSTRNYAPFYSHEEDMMTEYDLRAKSLKETYSNYLGVDFKDLSFSDLTKTNALVDNTEVIDPNEGLRNRYNNQEKNEEEE